MSRLQAGWRISIKGKASKEDIAAEVLKVLGELEAVGGIHEYSGINVYVNLYRNGKRVAVVHEGALLNGTEIFSKNSHVVMDSNNKNVVRYDTDVDFARLQEKSLVPGRSIFQPSNFIDFDAFEQLQEEKRIAQKAQIEERNRRWDIEYAEREAKKKETQNRLKAFKLFLIDRFNIDSGQFSKQIPSYAEVDYPSEKKKYLGADHPALSGVIFRATIRSTVNETKSVELFDGNHTLLKVIPS